VPLGTDFASHRSVVSALDTVYIGDTGLRRKVKVKAIPVRGLEGCEMLRIPHCLDNRLIDGGKVVSLTLRPHFTPQKHFLLFPVLISVRG
jgi:hypothetical protein